MFTDHFFWVCVSFHVPNWKNYSVKTLPFVIYTLIAFSGHPWVYCQQMKVETRISKNVILFC